MRVLPTVVSESTLYGERRVHAALVEVDEPNAVALHSLNLPEHSYKITSELDFVVVLDDIVLVIEVKAAGVSRSGGVWTYSDRAGHHRTSAEGPFKQADSGMYALRDRLRQLLGDAWLRDVAFGWLVVTPDVDLPSSFEWAEETYLGRGRFTRPSGMADGLRRAADYWLAKQRGCRPLGSTRRRELVRLLRPDFEQVPALSARVKQLDTAFERLTEEQIDRLDTIADNDRVLCTGGAGTGKTFLAAEVARREAAAGRRVALVCRSPVLAAFLETRLPHHNVQVLTADDFAVHTGPPFDCLVVDEAQDLMAFEFLDRADRLLLGGLDGGRWTIFYDPNRQSRLHGSFDRAAEQLLASQGAARAVLRRNCRNTRQIAFQTRAHTGADIGVATAGSGPEVRFPQVETVGDEAALLEAHLRDLRDQDVTDGSVTLLSASGDWSSTAARALRACRKGRLVRLDAASARRWPLEQLTWSSVVDFKGLENTFVCLIDLEDLADERALDLLYVAMTRARAGLWVATRPSVRTQLTALFTEHAPLALPTLQKGSA